MNPFQQQAEKMGLTPRQLRDAVNLAAMNLASDYVGDLITRENQRSPHGPCPHCGTFVFHETKRHRITHA
jgi:hypothetical protein